MGGRPNILKHYREKKNYGASATDKSKLWWGCQHTQALKGQLIQTSKGKVKVCLFMQNQIQVYSNSSLFIIEPPNRSH